MNEGLSSRVAVRRKGGGLGGVLGIGERARLADADGTLLLDPGERRQLQKAAFHPQWSCCGAFLVGCRTVFIAWDFRRTNEPNRAKS
jgi:hypothetical protein